VNHMKRERALRWSPELSGEHSERRLRALYPSPEHRVSTKKYTPNESDTIVMRAGQLHVVRGVCRLERGDSEWTLSAGEYVAIPDGRYSLCAVGVDNVEVVFVWSLPRAV